MTSDVRNFWLIPDLIAVKMQRAATLGVLHGTMHGLADPQLLRPPTERSCTPTHHSGEHNTSKKLS